MCAKVFQMASTRGGGYAVKVTPPGNDKEMFENSLGVIS